MPGIGHLAGSVGGGGGGSFCSEDSEREDARRRLIAWWSSEVASLDERIIPLRVVTDPMLDRFLAAEEAFPALSEDLPRALEPMATWITHRLTFETFFRDEHALDRALGGLYRESDAKRVAEFAAARRDREREARALASVRALRPPRATNERLDIDPALVSGWW